MPEYNSVAELPTGRRNFSQDPRAETGAERCGQLFGTTDCAAQPLLGAPDKLTNLTDPQIKTAVAVVATALPAALQYGCYNPAGCWQCHVGP